MTSRRTGLPKPPRVYEPKDGRPSPKAGVSLHQAGDLTRARSHHSHATANHDQASAQAWDRVHPRLTHRAVWLDMR